MAAVPIEAFEFGFMAYARNPHIRLDGWRSLEACGVDPINGWENVEINLSNSRAVQRIDNYR